jgi:exopolyphosphatase / guanosine-5'-triphosphate,3'-diphosphate pyrophosphatase
VRIAAIDLGSNSFHLVVVETRTDGSFVPLLREKEMLRLGDVVAREGSIPEPAVDVAVETVRRFRVLAESEGATEIVALGTAALREARNGSAVVDRIESESGVPVKVVSGLLEGQLVFEAVRASVVLDPEPALCADLGGGSLELMVGDRQGLRYVTSLHLGVGRLTAELIRHDPPSDKEVDRIRRRIAEELDPAMREVRRHRPRLLVGCAGSLCTLARMAAAERDDVVPDTVNQLTVSAADLAVVRKRILSLREEDRQRMPGLDAKRSELVPAAALVLEGIMEGSGLSELTVSEWGLREGIVISAIGQHDRAELGDDPRAIRRASVLALCRRCNWRSRHSYQVARLALQLFDAAAAVGLHKLDASDRELLELGALLHDIGEHVSPDGRDRHSAYLIENGRLRGFDPDEIHILVCLGRFHLRGTPRSSYPPYGALAGSEQERAVALVAILRLACALDRSHLSVVDSVDGRRIDGKLELQISASGDVELEEWAVRRKQALFEETFMVELALRVESSGRSRWEPTSEEGAGLA